MALTLQQVKDSKIASPPGAYFSLREAIENPDSSIADFSSIIGADPALAARLLKVVNSPFYGLTAKVETIPHALNIIGSDQLADLALATSVASQFDGMKNVGIDLEAFWKHSVGVGVAARNMAKFLNLPDVDRYYLAGMLHDIGKLILYREAPGQIETVLAQFDANNDGSMLAFEEKLMGFNHSQVGSILLNEWKLPSSIVNSVKGHHDPSKAKDNQQEAAVIHVADFLVYEMKLGSSGEPILPPLHKTWLKELNLTIDFINEAKPVIIEETEKALEMFL
ncbi:MAG: HDOD domain-containing protein [Candidatus Nitronauta litoralis]|uniref:HDOD domain-containing protein n=1 Tax=Candidatus Nitronauta litoralis TaxID=2705533 RepID=A0A7T0BZ25_9BACT|nr:MAG: HDOD domain-containing protein [Candidatus Nitronauta litoralis]